MQFEDLPPMEEICSECVQGQVDGFYETGVKKKKMVKCKYTCKNCGGRGKLLTRFGHALIQLTKEWNPMDDIRSDIRDLERRVN